MTDQIIGFMLFWAIWLVVPLLIDGATAVAYMYVAIRNRAAILGRGSAAPLRNYPMLSVIIPAHNAEDVLPACLKSIREQEYPHAQIEVLVIDNRSTDGTRAVVSREQEQTFRGALTLISLPYSGKSGALNAGIHHARGDIILNVDADAVLDRYALLEMARAFENDPQLAAATGSIEVLPPDQDPLTGEKRDVHPLRYLLGQAEFMEYYMGFRIGRQFQSRTNSLFTLAGAFSAFRRDVMMRTFMYERRTVSEDTDLTFFIGQKFPDLRVQAITAAIAFVHPTESFGALYAQRVRWQRGQLEVAALYPEFDRHPFRLRGISIFKSLIVDHTLAFPRIAWTFLLPFMFALGYPAAVVLTATLALYPIYMVIDTAYYLVALWASSGEARYRLKRLWWLPIFMPAYRWITFWFRIGGFMSVLRDEKQWKVRDPLSETADSIRRTGMLVVTFLTQSFLPRLAALLGGALRSK